MLVIQHCSKFITHHDIFSTCVGGKKVPLLMGSWQQLMLSQCRIMTAVKLMDSCMEEVMDIGQKRSSPWSTHSLIVDSHSEHRQASYQLGSQDSLLYFKDHCIGIHGHNAQNYYNRLPIITPRLAQVPTFFPPSLIKKLVYSVSPV